MSPAAGDAGEDQAEEKVWNYRLSALEKRVDAGFAHIDQRLDSLAYVRTETWVEREAARDQAYKALREAVMTEMAEAKRIGVWALGLVCGLVITSMGGFLLWIAQGGAG